ncbi:50S ribosomal protein L21 [Candidatus Peregrinibacteria bacterium]|nr:50S ribosomal protein L21 [Candidatus Peregrinibacteria bacterium]
MFAVVNIAGFQEKVQKGDKLKVPLLQGEPGTNLTFADVLLLCKEGNEVVIGTPTVKGASVEVAIRKHGKTDKVLVYKMHRRKRYRRTRGHRQTFTEIEVTGINA